MLYNSPSHTTIFSIFKVLVDRKFSLLKMMMYRKTQDSLLFWIPRKIAPYTHISVDHFEKFVDKSPFLSHTYFLSNF